MLGNLDIDISLAALPLQQTESIAKKYPNVYVCNVHVSTRERNPLAQIISELSSQNNECPKAILIAGATGFGKTSLLRAIATAAAVVSHRRTVWINGGVVGSKDHLKRLIDNQLDGVIAVTNVGSAKTQVAHNREVLFVVDDLDALIFKREAVAIELCSILRQPEAVSLVATGSANALSRIAGRGHIFGKCLAQMHAAVAIHRIQPLPAGEARALIERRRPGLSERAVNEIIGAAGGHPAALVFLSKLTALQGDVVPALDIGSSQMRDMILRASEFAGAVYAEAWTHLGPQQRAILWQFAVVREPTTASRLAANLGLSASHVSAQLSRLRSDGLIRRSRKRGHFSVAPLLANWVHMRASRTIVTRSDVDGGSWDGRTEPS